MTTLAVLETVTGWDAATGAPDVECLVEAADSPWPGGYDPSPATNPAVRDALETDGEGCSEWPEAPDFEPLTQAQFEALVRRLMLLRAEREAIACNSEAMCTDLDRQIARILVENEPQLRHYIDGGYGRKSARCIYGLCGVRKSGGRLRVVDLRRALESVREMAPSALLETIDTAKLPPNFTAPGFDTTPETSSLYVAPMPRNRKRGETEDAE